MTGNPQSFIRPIQENDWERFDFYASRTRDLGCGSHILYHETRFKFDLCLLSDLFSFPRGKPFLPDLQRVVLGEEYTSSFNLFIGPYIRSMTCRLPWINWMPETFLVDLPRISPSIEEFDFKPSKLKAFPTLPRMDEFICRQRHLRTLRIQPRHFAEKTIMHLANLPRLTSLEGYWARPSDIPLLTSSSSHFRALRELHLWIDDWSSCANLIRSLSSPLTILKIHYGYLTGSLRLAELANLIDTIAHHPCSKILSKLRLFGISDINIPTSCTGSPVHEAFRPLFTCKALTNVTLEMNVICELDNDWLECPRLGLSSAP